MGRRGSVPSSKERTLAVSDEWIEAALEKELNRERAEEEGIGNVLLCLFPDADAEGLRATLREGYARFEAGAYEQARRLFGVVRARLTASALETVALHAFGAYCTLEALDAMLRADAPAVHDPDGIYASTRARALLDALGAWEARAGNEADAVIALVAETGIPESMVAHAYRTMKRMLEMASTHPCALLWLLDDRPHLLEDAPADEM